MLSASDMHQMLARDVSNVKDMHPAGWMSAEVSGKDPTMRKDSRPMPRTPTELPTRDMVRRVGAIRTSPLARGLAARPMSPCIVGGLSTGVAVTAKNMKQQGAWPMRPLLPAHGVA